MVRSLYRVYLYAMSILLMIFMAVSVSVLLAQVFALSPQLRGQYGTVPARADIARAAVFAIVAWVIGLGLLGLHYWLIRRDIRDEPAAANGAVRAFFLNGAQALATVVAVFSGAGVFSTLGQPFRGDLTGELAATIGSLALALAFELERRRSRPAPGVALVFERLHVYGLPLFITLIAAAVFWMQALQQSVVSALITGDQIPNGCPPATFGQCPVQNPAWLWAAALWVAAVWGFYALLGRGDGRTIVGRVMHLLGFGYGTIFALVGITRGAELGLRVLLGVGASWQDFAFTYSFMPPLVFGAVVLAAYGLRLRAEGVSLPAEAPAIRLLVTSVVAGLAAVFFWLGFASVLHTLVEWFYSNSEQSSTAVWATDISYLVAGIAYPPLVMFLSRDTARTGIPGPRRALVFALLAAGILTAAVGAVVALYTLLSGLLGVPVSGSDEATRTAVVALVVGLMVTGLHLRVVLSERGRGKPPTPKPVPVQVPSPSAGLPA